MVVSYLLPVTFLCSQTKGKRHETRLTSDWRIRTKYNYVLAAALDSVRLDHT